MIKEALYDILIANKYLLLTDVQELMIGTLKIFYKWRLAVKHMHNERRRLQEETVPREHGGSFLPPVGLRRDALRDPSMLLWEKSMGLRPHVELPRRKDCSGKTVAVCQRCARVYAKLQLYREARVESLLSKVRENCAQLQVSGFSGGGGGGSVQESAMWQLGEEERERLLYQRGLLHHARHLMPDSVGRLNVMQHAALAAHELGQPSLVSVAASAREEPEWGEGILPVQERSASVDLGHFCRPSPGIPTLSGCMLCSVCSYHVLLALPPCSSALLTPANLRTCTRTFCLSLPLSLTHGKRSCMQSPIGCCRRLSSGGFLSRLFPSLCFLQNKKTWHFGIARGMAATQSHLAGS